MLGWESWKKSFDAWENATAQLLEQHLKSPLVLGPSGAMLTAAMKAKAAADKAMASWWGALGLPTKRDQERAMHALNQLQSRLIDLEQRLEQRPEQRPEQPADDRDAGK
jgi:hypothetical protein